MTYELGFDTRLNADVVQVTDTHIVTVHSLIFNDRVVLSERGNWPEVPPRTYVGGWCFDKGGSAHVAAAIWDLDNEPEPSGFKKRVGDH